MVSSAFMCGCCFSKRLYKRRDFLRSFSAFLDSMSTDIRYTSDDIFTVVSRCCNFKELECFNVSDNCIAQPFENAWNECIENIPKQYVLTQEDLAIVKELGLKLGKTDVEGQLKHIEHYRVLIENQLKKAEEEISQKSRLYRVLGLFCGIIVAIMIM